MRLLPGNVLVRTANRGEAAEVAAAVRRAFITEAEVYGADLPPLHETEEDVLAAFDADDVTMVAETAGRVIGTVRAETLASGAVMVRRLGVDAEWRGLGIARELMIALEAAYPQTTRFELFTGSLSVGALALYESLGYRYVRTETVAPGVDLLYFEKSRPAGSSG